MKGLYEAFANFFENPTRVGLKEIIQYNVGESNHLDFKKEWPVFSKLSRHILALANSGGGCIVVGVEEIDNGDLNPCGICKRIDKAQINSQVMMYVPSNLKFDVMDFTFDESEYNKIKGKNFQVLFVEYDASLIPFISKKEGDGIKENGVYTRTGTSSQLADYQQLQSLINARINTHYNSSTELKVEEHLRQLKMLYAQVNKYHVYYTKGNNSNQFAEFASSVGKAILGERKEVSNPNYPKEEYEEFISDLITKKKRRIEFLLEV